MALIRRLDTIGVKTLLRKGEFGLDMHTSGGDVGRVYVGTGTYNVPLARLDELIAETVVATDGQTVVDIGNTSSVAVAVDGVYKLEGVDYNVTGPTTIQFVTPLTEGDVVKVIDISFVSNYVTAITNVANGIAGLDSNGLVAAAQLPSYVDDVIEVATYAALPVSGEASKVYIVVADETQGGDTSSYRWTGSVYALVSNTLSAADVKALYESNLDTNAFTDSYKTKLDSIEPNAKDDQLASEVPYDNTTSTMVSVNVQAAIDEVDVRLDAAETKLSGIEPDATADQTAAEIEALYESNLNTNKYTDLENQFVDVVTVLDTVATTLPSAVNEVHTELDSVTGRVTTAEGTLAAHVANDGSDHTFIDQNVTTTSSPTFANITVMGVVDGRDVSVDGAKLDTVETNAKDDQLASEVPYSNTTSGLSSITVQSAIDEVNSRVTALSTIEEW